MRTITISRALSEKITITLPCFRYWKGTHYKIVNEKETICVDPDERKIVVATWIPNTAFGDDTQESNEAAFVSATETTLNRINIALNN